MTIVDNATGGIVGGFVGLFGDTNSMTLGSSLVVSRIHLGNDPSANIVLAHEYGHIAQAQQLGNGYLPSYLMAIPQQLFDFGVWNVIAGVPISLHDSHPMEIDANNRANLIPFPDSFGGLRYMGR